MQLTLANQLTLLRVAIVPALAIMVMIDGYVARLVALLLFTTAAVTDYLDGHIARARGEITEFGRCLDPIADKLLVATVLIALVAADRAPWIPVLIIVLRELGISGLREFLAGRGPSLPVTQLAKWKTTVQMVALALLIIGDLLPFVRTAGDVALWLAALLTVVTAVGYVRSASGFLGVKPKPARPAKVDARSTGNAKG
ncbi:MAG: CDP-diacylglycerol--glycerol-3-phosphate 3-phosphatidyltransferase [Geminicoccaceae bacterium]|nr:MAG: CDP-diacylglycerol--glycerol-3-phosphate 3-phosphatidyltransferase [Geminicoccaceae bacterium]